MFQSLTNFAADLPTASASSSTTAIIVVAVLSLLGTIATVGYKYKNTEKRQDPNQIIFDQVNNFIAEQRIERDDLRKELAAVKKEVKQLTEENEKLHIELSKERARNNKLERKVASLTNRADVRDTNDIDTKS